MRIVCQHCNDAPIGALHSTAFAVVTAMRALEVTIWLVAYECHAHHSNVMRILLLQAINVGHQELISRETHSPYISMLIHPADVPGFALPIHAAGSGMMHSPCQLWLIPIFIKLDVQDRGLYMGAAWMRLLCY